MEREVDIERAKRRIRKLLGIQSRKKKRFHRSAAERALHRLRSLEGQCGNCESMWLRFFTSEDKKLVDVHCSDGHNPTNLYRNVDLGHEADCSDFKPVDK